MPVDDADGKVRRARRIAAAAIKKAAEAATSPAVNRTTALHRSNKIKADGLDEVVLILSGKEKR